MRKIKVMPHQMSRISFCAVIIAYVIFGSLLFGCGAATITPQENAVPNATVQRPDKIVVYDFSVSAEDVTQNQGPLQRVFRAATENSEQQDADRLAAGREAAQNLSADLVKRLQELGFNAENLPRGTPPGGNTMTINGQFLSADEGNRARRLIIGFGAGASKLDTQVTVSQVSSTGMVNQLLSFTTHADSGKMPGAAVTMGAGAAAQGASAATMAAGAATGAAKTYGSMLSTLSNNTSKQITAYLSQYFLAQGWISPDQAQKVKLAA
jgi:hypothetical protein